MEQVEARALLGVSAAASPAEVEAAYRRCEREVRQLFQTAQSRSVEAEYEQQLKALQEARDLLLKPPPPPSSVPVPSPVALKPGAVFGGRFKLQRALGSGDEGGVWLAEDRRLNRTVTLKLLPDTICSDPGALAELKDVTLRSSKLIHANIARTYEFVETEGIAAAALEYVDGETLTQLRLEKPEQAFEAKELMTWVRSLCEALEYAHGQMKLVHGGLRPDNLLVNAGGQLKLTGFGLAGRIKAWLARLGLGSESNGTVVASGDPPPRCRTEPVVSDDVYGVGATLYELLTGTAPFEGMDLLEPGKGKPVLPMAKRRSERGIKGEAIPAPWEQTVAACLASDPAQRPQSAAELAARFGLAAA